MQRYTVISADCHGGATDSQGGFTEYVDAAYRDRLREHTAEKRRQFNESLAKLFDPDFMAEQDDTDAALEGGRSGAYDADRRIVELQADGIVADVIFPDGTQDNTTPFDASSGPGAKGADWELQSVGAWAYNRWLADFCALHPGRHAGIAVITVHDLDETVRQVTWAKEHDLRGVLLPAGVGTLPFYNHPRYEPLWAVCADLGVPLHTHVGSAVPDYGDLPGANALFAMESTFFSHRPFWFLIWGGVFESHPDLTMVFAEQGSDWVPDTLKMMDNMYGYMFRHEQARLKSRPSEYWHRQCYVQAMFFRASEADRRHEIGIGNMLWGSDYPHYEGSWPNSRKVIHEALHGAPESEIRAILGENAARLYGFDLAMLDRIAAEVGPTIDEI
jgi:predicted TIM-barrel fold metal-dependent hydrolase